MPRIIVERSFDPPLTPEALKQTEERMAPYLPRTLSGALDQELLVGRSTAHDLRIRGGRYGQRTQRAAGGRSRV